jgi:hypothetical protein
LNLISNKKKEAEKPGKKEILTFSNPPLQLYDQVVYTRPVGGACRFCLSCGGEGSRGGEAENEWEEGE